jgi:hypothetical protein
VSAHLHASNYGIVVVEECSRLRRTQSELDSACRVVRRTSYYKTVTVGWWRVISQNGDLTSQKHDASLVSWDWRALASALPLTQSTGRQPERQNGSKAMSCYTLRHQILHMRRCPTTTRGAVYRRVFWRRTCLFNHLSCLVVRETRQGL